MQHQQEILLNKTAQMTSLSPSVQRTLETLADILILNS